MASIQYIALVYYILSSLWGTSCIGLSTKSASHTLEDANFHMMQMRSTASSSTTKNIDVQCPSILGECKGFPDRSPKPLSSRTLHSKVLVSISAMEMPLYVRALLENALKYTSENTSIILHLNANTDYPAAGADKDFDWIWSNPRVEVNCNRVPVVRETGTILQAQMSNVEWAQCRGIVSDFFVFQASNSMWLKSGMEAYVEKHVTSVPKITSSAMCQNFELDTNRHAYQQCKEVTMLEVEGAARSSVGAIKPPICRHHALEGEQFPVCHDACVTPPFEGIKFVLQRKHEGSFYPTKELNRIVSMTTRNSQRRLQAKPQDNCTTMSPNVFDTPHFIEETYFQTWFANHETIEGTGDIMCVLIHELDDTDYRDRSIHPLDTYEGWTTQHIPFFLSREGVFLVKHPGIRNMNLHMMTDLEQRFPPN